MKANLDQPSLITDPVWKLWLNPLVIRSLRSRMRLRRSAPWIVAVLIFSSFLFFTTYLTATRQAEISPRDAARSLILPMFLIQGFILMLLGTGSVASGLVQDKVGGTLDYQRLTPMKPMAKILGLLFGLPIREYCLAAITLPYTVFALWVGEIDWTTWVPVYAVFFSSVILYHMTGMAAGMITRQWRFAARFTHGLVILLYLILPQFAHLGLYAFQYLTVRPVFMVAFLHQIPGWAGGNEGIAWLAQSTVPFFHWKMSTFLFSLLLQSGLIVTLVVMCRRKWRDQDQHALSKPFGVGLFAAVAALVLGNLWPVITRDTSVNLPLLGALSGEQIEQGLVVVLPLTVCFALLFAAMWILFMVIPTHHEVLRGWRRVFKLHMVRMPFGWNERPAGPIVLILGIIGCATVAIELEMLTRHAFFPEGLNPWTSRTYLPLAWVVAIVSFYLSVTLLEPRRIIMTLLLGWILPALVAIFAGAAFAAYNTAVYLSAVSPFFLMLYGSFQLIAGDWMVGSEVHPTTIQHAYWIGLTTHLVFILWAGWRWNKQHRLLQSIAASATPNIPKALLQEDAE
jgi:hypothetical protein